MVQQNVAFWCTSHVTGVNCVQTPHSPQGNVSDRRGRFVRTSQQRSDFEGFWQCHTLHVLFQLLCSDIVYILDVAAWVILQYTSLYSGTLSKIITNVVMISSAWSKAKLWFFNSLDVS
jgi:hypothetical protein